ncbi:hypothetical protein [Bacteroidetes bacterium endosymbiont of Geopemphigus sp.]|uniref:hypothetical protein n=1 Tax=Bacteroidetes bacterium endosymbiont of Geopemphigus sp. TaxID=2047937 RepID=UPI000CD07801|nr:hypothetical protein [Bacteroidetes bacterium endosymbiont of Geopemphigus sp.]
MPNTYLSNIDLRKAKNFDQICGVYITSVYKDKKKMTTINSKRYMATISMIVVKCLEMSGALSVIQLMILCPILMT